MSQATVRPRLEHGWVLWLIFGAVLLVISTVIVLAGQATPAYATPTAPDAQLYCERQVRQYTPNSFVTFSSVAPRQTGPRTFFVDGWFDSRDAQHKYFRCSARFDEKGLSTAADSGYWNTDEIQLGARY